MNLEKMLYVISITFCILFVLSAILVLTNTLNMWLVGIISLVICISSFVATKFVKTNK